MPVAPEPFETAPAVPGPDRRTSCPSSSTTAPPTTRTTGSRGSRPTRATGSRSSTPRTLTDPLFPPVENLRMSNRIQASCPDYPIQQYFGDYQHFVQNKAKEWGDLCGADHHVCTFADYPGGDVNATPTGLVPDRRHDAAEPLHRPLRAAARQPERSRSRSSTSRRRFRSARRTRPPSSRRTSPGRPSRPAASRARAAHACASTWRARRRRPTTPSRTRTPSQADPVANLFINGGRCPVHDRAGRPGRRRLRQPAARRARDDDRRHEGDRRLHGLDRAGRAAERAPLRRLPRRHRGDGRPRPVPRRRARAAPATFELHGNGWRFEPGHRIRIELAQDDAPYLKTSRSPRRSRSTA